jgi:hypothetical protein
MRRRHFITLIGGAAASWPLAARAQQRGMPVVGLLNGVSFEGAFAPYVDEIRIGLKETGLWKGRTSRSNTAPRTVTPSVSRTWRPISSAAVLR